MTPTNNLFTHTPEGWRLLTPVIMPVAGHHIIAATDASTGRDFPIAHVFHFGDKPEESDANARLIAAAPELLTAAKCVLDLTSGALCHFDATHPAFGHIKQAHDMARAVVLKAEGRA